MATPILLEPATIAALDAVMASGRFASRDEAIRDALHFVESHDTEVDMDALSPAERAAIEEGLADIAAGRVYSLDEVFDELEQRCLQRR